MFAVTPVTALANCIVKNSVPPEALAAIVKVQPDGTLISSTPLVCAVVLPTVSVVLVPLGSCKLTDALFNNANLPIVCVGTFITVALLLNCNLSEEAGVVLFGDQLVAV